MPGGGDRVRRRSRDCDAVAERLPAYVAGEADLDERDLRHLATCLRCQADVARYRRLLRILHAMRNDGSGPLADLLGQLDRGRRVPWAALGIAAVAGAAGAAGAILVGGRRWDRRA